MIVNNETIMELATGIYVLPQSIDRDGEQVTIHPAAIETQRGLMLVDTGWPGKEAQIAANLEAIGHEWSDVSSVLLTHQDGDHAGAVAEVIDRTEAIVYAHANCAPYVDGRKEPIKSPEGERYAAVPVDIAFQDNLTIRTNTGPMEVIYTPGHAPGHVALYFPDESLLLAADALTADESGLQGPSEVFTLEMDEALQSARNLAERDIAHILCYHGGYVEEGSDRIVEVVDARR